MSDPLEIFVRQPFNGNQDGCHYCGRMSNLYRYGWINGHGSTLDGPGYCSVGCWHNMNMDRVMLDKMEEKIS